MLCLLLICSCLQLVAGQSTPVKLLVLVPWPSDRADAGWDVGLDLLAAGRVAANEVNNATDLLKDYHIELVVPEYGTEACALTDTSQGVINFVQHSIKPPGQVLAVLGLYCSTSTAEISSLAGHESVQLIHLSAANSPIFRPDSKTVLIQPDYPHLWRFLVSAGSYADMMIQLMKQFNWHDIVILYTEEHRFYAGIANVLLNKAVNASITDHATNIVLTSTSDENFHQIVLNEIKQQGRIIFLAATNIQIVKLLCKAAEEGMLYPDIMWVIPDRMLRRLEYELSLQDACPKEMFHKAINGTILSFLSLRQPDDDENVDETLVSGDTYFTYMSRYSEELDIVAKEYNMTLNGQLTYAGLLYDQVWAFALALNSSIPLLSERNLSVNDIGSLGYSRAKEILEKELAELDFRGASGHIRFSSEREVSTSINLFQVINGTQNSVGNCTLDNGSVLFCNVTLAEAPPPSDFDKVYVHVPLGVATGLLFAAILVIVLVSSALILFMYHRNRPEIKAASWKLSLLLFIACYILCVYMVLVVSQSQKDHVAYCYIQPLLLFNGINFFLITLFLKILRIHHIFHNKHMKDLGWRCSNSFLILGSIALSAVPNIFFIFWYSIDHKILKEDSQLIFADVRYYQVIQTCQSETSSEYLNLLILIPYTYLLFFTLGNIVLATRTAKTYEHFKDTKKINFLMAILFVVSVSIEVILAFASFETRVVYRYSIFFVATYLYSSIIVGLIFFFIFMPKLWWMKKYMHMRKII